MAGIGFELKGLFKREGLFALTLAYGYAGIICTGPMLLGVVLLLGIRALAFAGGGSTHDAELLNCMVTYTLLASLTVSNCFTYITTRYTADKLYEKRDGEVFPSFLGSISIMLVAGGALYLTFLCFAGISIIYILLNIFLFLVLVLVWTEMTYLMAIKDYKNIMLAFACTLTLTLVLGYLVVRFNLPLIEGLLASVTVGYGVLMVWYFILLRQYFPEGNVTSMEFLRWFDKFPQLGPIGLLYSLGMFGHLVIMWTSHLGVQVQGLFYGAPKYDIPALIAFMSTLVTVVNFVTSTEVNFYPKYKAVFGLFNDGGSYADIVQAETEMKTVMRMELEYLFARQFFTTVIFVVFGTILLPALPLGMDEEAIGIFQILCIGYGFYAIGNAVSLMLMYFSDNSGALVSMVLFAVLANAATFLFKDSYGARIGLGFTIGGAVFAVIALVRLYFYLKKLSYHVLSSQPVYYIEKKGLFTRIAVRCEKRYSKTYKGDF